MEFTFNNIRELFTKYNALQDETKIKLKPLEAVVIISKDSFTRSYSEFERSYRFDSDNKMFHAWMNSSSLFANSLDGTDVGVRLDYYLNSWKFEKCYLVD